MHREQEAADARRVLAEIERVESKVRFGGRWAGWLWFFLGIVISVFGVLAPPVTRGWAEYAVTLGFPIMGVLALLYAWRQRVISQTYQRLQYPIVWIFCILVVVDAVFRIAIKPSELSVWVIAFGILPAIPCWYGAWRVWRG